MIFCWNSFKNFLLVRDCLVQSETGFFTDALTVFNQMYGFRNGWHRFKPTIDIEILAYECSCIGTEFFFSTSAARLSPKCAQPGELLAPNRRAFIRYSATSFDGSPFSHQKKRNMSLCYSETTNGWNMLLMSVMKALISWRKRHRIPNKSFIKSGPCSR